MAKARRTKLTKKDIDYGYGSVFPTRLRKLLNNTTQDILAEHVGVSRQAVAQWKDGLTKPDIYFLLKIADYFEVSTDYLLGLSDAKTIDDSVQAISKVTGLTDEAISALRTFKNNDIILGSSDESAGNCAALSRALAFDEFLQCIASVLTLPVGERGYHFDGILQLDEHGLYPIRVSPDMLVEQYIARLCLVLNAIRTNDTTTLQPYPPFQRAVLAETEKLRLQGRLVERRDEKNGKETSKR